MTETTVSDVVGKIGPPAGKLPTPKAIKAGSATVVAYAMIEELLDANLMDDSSWLTFWEERGVTRLSQMVWAYVNQDAFADEEEERFSLLRVQAAINARNLHDYMLAILRAFGQEAFADGFEKVLEAQRERIIEAAANLEIDGAGMPQAPEGVDALPDPTRGGAAAKLAADKDTGANV